MMERKSSTQQDLPSVRGNTSSPEPGVPSDKKATSGQAKNEKKETIDEKLNENRSPSSASLADPLLNTMAFKESV